MSWHIDPRELQAAYLALKIFSPSQINQLLFHIQLQIDNQAAVSYINHLGGTHSQLLWQLSLDLWYWSLSRQIHISAIQQTCRSYVKKVRANCRMEVELCSVPKDCCSLRDATDLFATRANTQFRTFVLWIPDPQSTAIAFSVHWSDPLSYAFPPFSLIIRCVQRMKNQNGKMLLVTPVWRSRPW